MFRDFGLLEYLVMLTALAYGVFLIYLSLQGKAFDLGVY